MSVPLVPEYLVEIMKRTPQEPAFHREGDVWTHTEMVANQFNRDIQEDLLIAALWHDTGKAYTTQTIEGVIRAPNHAARSKRLFVPYAYRHLGLPLGRINNIAALIRYHSFPLWCLDKTDHEIFRVFGALRKPKQLIDIARADVEGRLSENLEDMRLRIKLCELTLAEADLRHFGDYHAAYRYSIGRGPVPIYAKTYNPNFTVYIMAGLQGSGKSTRAEQLSDWYGVPTLSLDQFRIDGYSKKAEDNVVRMHKEVFSNLLRDRKSFIMDSTNLTYEQRQKLYRQIRSYGGTPELTWVHVPYKQLIERSRLRSVPLSVIERNINKMQIPHLFECERVYYFTNKN